VPDGSRAALPGHGWLAERLTDASSNDRIRSLAALAAELDCSLPQLAIAWCAANTDVSSVITGASRPEQVVEDMGALAVLPRLDAAVLARIDGIVGTPGPA